MQNISILVVDDEEPIRIKMGKVMGRYYKNVILAENGEDGLEKYKTLKPDVVVSDIRMPKMDGLEMIGKIRESDKEIPIIVISAFSDSENLMQAINLGVDRFIPKPIDINILKVGMQKISESIITKKSNTKLLEKMNILTQAILQSSDGICIYDKSEGFIFFNDTFLDLFRKHSIQIMEKNSAAIFIDYPEILEHLDNQLPQMDSFEIKMKKRGEGEEYYKVTATPVFNTDGKHGGTLLAFHDITYDKELERELQSERDMAVKSNRFKTEFLSAMSHDIRTPMNIIVGLTDLLISQSTQADQEKNLNLIKKSGENLVHLVNDILDVSKIEAGKLEIENFSFDLPGVLNFLKEMFHEKAQKKNIEFVLNIDKSVRQRYTGDPYRLQQVLINLIGNSFKFTESGKITLFIVEKSQDSKLFLEFVVADTGVGIAKENLEKIFGKFEQEESSTTRKYGGTGLGLSIAKNLTGLMGGEIKVVSPALLFPGSKESPGTEFTFTIEVTPGESENKEHEKEKAKEKSGAIELIRQKKITALVAEDNPVNQMLLAKILNFLEVESDVAHDGEEAIEKAMKNNYQLIFMDIEMPEKSGVDATMELRENNIETPIIACTAHNFKDDLKEYLESGMNHYIVKPVSKENVMEAIVFTLNLT